MAVDELQVLAVQAADAAVPRTSSRRIHFARSLVIGVSVVAAIGLAGIIFFPPGASAGGPTIRVVVRTSDGDLGGMGSIIEDLGGRVERRLARTGSIVAVLPQDSLDELWSYPSVLGVADEGIDFQAALG